MTDPVEQPRPPAKWHESAASVVMTAILFGAIAVVCTAPCWALAIVAAVTR